MPTKTVYQTGHLGLYVGLATAYESPLEPGVFLIPGGCVEVQPPDAPEGKIQRWNGKRWELLNYLNGLVVYSTANGDPLTLKGTDLIPNGYTEQKPEPGQIWKNGRWVDDPETVLSRLYAVKLEQINTGCAHSIESGFSSDALGNPHRYDSRFTDQMNLTGLILSRLDALCSCYSSEGERMLREHTADQLHVVGQHLVTHKQTAIRQAETLKRALAEAANERDLPAMQAIEWSMPA